MRLGAGVRIGRDVILRADPGALLLVADGVAIGDGARVHARGGLLRIGAGRRSWPSTRRSPTRCTSARSASSAPWARAEGDAVLAPRARLAAHAVALRGARGRRRAELVPAYAVVERASRSES